MTPKILVVGVHPTQLRAINDFIINDYGKWFELWDYNSCSELFHAIQLWVLDAGIGPNYCIIKTENILLAMKKGINAYGVEILAPTNDQIEGIIRMKPPKRKEDDKENDKEDPKKKLA